MYTTKFCRPPLRAMTDRIKAVCELADFTLEGMKWPCQEVLTEVFLCESYGLKVRCRLDGRLPVTVAWRVMARLVDTRVAWLGRGSNFQIIRCPDVAGYWVNVIVFSRNAKSRAERRTYRDDRNAFQRWGRLRESLVQSRSGAQQKWKIWLTAASRRDKRVPQ